MATMWNLGGIQLSGFLSCMCLLSSLAPIIAQGAGKPTKDSKYQFSWYSFINSLQERGLAPQMPLNPVAAASAASAASAAAGAGAAKGKKQPFTPQNPAQLAAASAPSPVKEKHDDIKNHVNMPPDAYCSQESVEGLRAYCKSLKDGNYFDPWNPYCGYIQCENEKPNRIICKQGTWMGAATGAQLGQYYMCRKPLAVIRLNIGHEASCPVKTDDLNRCRKANKRVSHMNVGV